jgi:hypothetical protein
MDGPSFYKICWTPRTKRVTTKPLYSSLLRTHILASIVKSLLPFFSSGFQQPTFSFQRSWLKHHVTSRKVTICDSKRSLNYFNFPNPSRLTRPWIYLIYKRNDCQEKKNTVLRSRGRPVRKDDNLTSICEGTSTAHNPIDLHDLLREYSSICYFVLDSRNLRGLSYQILRQQLTII